MKSLRACGAEEVLPKKAESLSALRPRTPLSSSEAVGIEADCPGPWLRAWVEFQVDARINQAFRDLAEGEIFGSGRVSTAAAGPAAFPPAAAATAERASEAAAEAGRACQQLGQEVRVVATAQAHILSVLDGLSGRVEQLGASSAASPKRAVEGASSSVTSRRWEQDSLMSSGKAAGFSQALDRLESRLTELRDEASQRQHQCSDKLASALDVLAGTQREVGMLAQALDRLDHRVSEHEVVSTASTVAPSEKPQMNEANLASEIGSLREVQGRLEARCERFDRDIAGTNKARTLLEARFEELRKELASAVVTREDFQQGLEDLATDFAEAFASLKAGLQQASQSSAGREENHRGFEERVEAWQVELQKELAAEHDRLAAELRNEMKACLRNENSNVEALDEQLWLTDQRLGQRLDELGQRVALVMDHLESLPGPLTESGAGPKASMDVRSAPNADSEAAAGQESRALRRVHLNASRGKRAPSRQDETFSLGATSSTLGVASDLVPQQNLPEGGDRASGENDSAEVARSPPPATERAAPSRSVGKQLLRSSGPWSAVSDAISTAAEALSGGDEEERRQLARLARLERVQERAVSPADASLEEASASTPTAHGSREEMHLRPQGSAGRLGGPRAALRVISTGNDGAPSNSPHADKTGGASALTAAAARVARRRGPFLAGASST